MGFIVEPEDEELEKQITGVIPVIEPSEQLLDQVQETTISEDSEDVRDIAAGLLRAYTGKGAEVGGAPSITSVGQLTRRAEDIESAIERLPGEENTLGLLRTGFSIGKFFVDNIVGVANTIAVPLGVVDTSSADPFAKETLLTKPQKQYEKKRYVDYYDRLREKEGRSIAGAALSTTKKIFDESPELKNEGEFVKGVVDRLAGQIGTITEREANEITGYWRPEASTTEQVVRAIPEFIGATTLGIRFLTRNKKQIIKEFEELSGVSVFKATEADIVETTAKMMDKAGFPLASALRFGGLRKNLYGKRIASNVRLKQMNEKFRAANRDVEAARRKVISARKNKDKQLIERESAALRLARSERVNAIPKELIEIPITEAGALTGALIAGNYFGEEYGALFGALGGGFGSVVGFSKVYDLAAGSVRGIGSLITSLGGSIGLLSDEQLSSLAKKGIISGTSNLPRRDQKALEDFAYFIRSLPEQARENAFAQLKFFREVRDDLADAGVDPEVLETTLGKATGLVPLMMMKNTITTYKLDLSKGVGKVDKELENLLKNEDNINKTLGEFRGLIDELSGAVRGAGVQNERFNSFVAAVRGVATEENVKLTADSSTLKNLVDDFIDKANNPTVGGAAADKEALEEIIEMAMRQGFLKAGDLGEDASLIGLREALPELERTGVEASRRAEAAAIERETDLLEFLVDHLDPQQYQNNAQESAKNLLEYAKYRRHNFKAKASAQFEALKNLDLEVDITDWLKGLYSDDAYSSIIPYGKSARVKQQLSQTRVAKASALDSLARVEGSTGAQKALEKSPALREAIREGMLQEGIDVGEDVTYLQVRNFIMDQAGVDNMSDFDVFIVLKEISEELDLPELKITASVEDIQKLSSSFSRDAARYNKGGQLDLARKSSNLSEELINQIPETGDTNIRQKIKSAKENYINNVIRRFRDKEGNPIGFELNKNIDPEDAVKIIDMNAIVTGDTQLGTDVINQINKTFGGYYSETGEYVLGQKGRLIVRNLMNDLLARHISERETVRTAKRLAEGPKMPLSVDRREPLSGVGTPGLDPARQAEKARLGRQLQQERALKQAKPIEYSPAMEVLEKAGLIDYDQVLTYNKHIEIAEGVAPALSEADRKVKADTLRAARRVKSLLNEREKFLGESMRYLPTQEGARTIGDYDRFLEFFITNPQGQQRFEAMLPQIAKKMNKSPEEARDIFKEITIESLSRATYGDMKEARPGKYSRDFDYQAFINYVTDPNTSKAIQNIVGEETFKTISRMADFMNVQNRDIAARLRDSGIQVTTPKGLSVESLLSRTYSISRGVISPKYVATEVALLSFRKQKAKALSRILSDPKMVDAVIDIIESEGTDIRKYNGDLFTALINGLGYHENMKKEERTRKQIIQLELDKLRR